MPSNNCVSFGMRTLNWEIKFGNYGLLSRVDSKWMPGAYLNSETTIRHCWDPIDSDLQVSDTERAISLTNWNWEYVLAFLRNYTHRMALQMIQKRADGKSVTSIDFDRHRNYLEDSLRSSNRCFNPLTGGVMSRAYIKKSWGTDEDDKCPFCGQTDT